MFSRRNGLQLFGLFIVAGAFIFLLSSLLFLKFEAEKTTVTISEQVLDIKLNIVERYLAEMIEAQERIALRIAASPAVVSSVLEGIETPQRLQDDLRKLKSPEIRSWVNLYNFAGGLEYREIPISDRFDAYIKRMIRTGELFTQNAYSFYEHLGEQYLIITTPLRYNGLEEGVLVYQAQLTQEQHLNNLAQSDSQWFAVEQSRLGWQPNLPQGWQWQEKHLPQYDLTLKYATAPTLLEKTEYDLMLRLFQGTLLATLLTVAVLYFFGQHLLVSPYQALFNSEQKLEKQAIELKAQAMELQQREAESNHLARVVKNMRDAVVFTNRDVEITWVNHAFENMTGYRFDEIVGQKPTILQGERTDPKVKGAIREHIHFERHGTFELVNYTKSGKAYWLELALTPLYNGDGKLEGFMGVERDITERKRLEQSLAKTAKEAQSANLAKSQFLASMSHELRTPMNGILGVGEILSHTKLNEEQRELVETLTGSGKHMLSVLNDILDFSKVEAGKLEIHPNEFALSDLGSRLSRIYQTLCDEKGIEFEFIVEEPDSTLCIADETRLVQMMQNLLNNAWKFTQSGKIVAKLLLESTPSDSLLHIIVSDTGVGIPKDKQNTIFEPFSQADSDTTRRFGGSGLGLAIVTKLTKIMNGSIDVVSEVGKGSVFSIVLPVQLKKHQLEYAPTRDDKFDGRGLRALIIEDNRVNVIILGKFLKARNIEYDTAANGEIGVEKVREQLYDLILVDNHMPVMDGYQAVQHIRKLPNGEQSVVIGCTADVFEETRSKLLAAGCVNVINKPINGSLLDKVLFESFSVDRIYGAERDATNGIS